MSNLNTVTVEESTAGLINSLVELILKHLSISGR